MSDERNRTAIENGRGMTTRWLAGAVLATAFLAGCGASQSPASSEAIAPEGGSGALIIAPASPDEAQPVRGQSAGVTGRSLCSGSSPTHVEVSWADGPRSRSDAIAMADVIATGEVTEVSASDRFGPEWTYVYAEYVVTAEDGAETSFVQPVCRRADDSPVEVEGMVDVAVGDHVDVLLDAVDGVHYPLVGAGIFILDDVRTGYQNTGRDAPWVAEVEGETRVAQSR